MMPRGSRLRDYLMRRDGRNPYGSRGGYVTSRRDRGMDYGDMARGRDYAGNDYGDMARGRDYGYDYGDYAGSDYARGGDRGKYPFELEGTVEMDFARRRNSRGQFMRDGHYPMYPMYMDYGMDYASGEKLSEEDLKEWYDELCEEIPEQYKHLYKKEKIEEVAKQMGVQFDKFKPMELTVTATMLASDYQKSISPSDIQRYVSLAQEWLNDKDSNLKGAEKLSAYYDNIVKG